MKITSGHRAKGINLPHSIRRMLNVLKLTFRLKGSQAKQSYCERGLN